MFQLGRFAVLLLLFVVSSLTATAQQKRASDSIYRLIVQHPQEDTVKAKLYYALSRALGYNYIDSSIHILNKAEQIAARYKNYMLMGAVRMRSGVTRHVNHEPHTAIADFYKAAEYYKAAKRPDMLIDVYRSITNTHMLIDENDKAITASQLIIDAAYAIKDTIQVALVHDFRASLYISINQYAEAIAAEQKALDISKQIHRKKLTAKILANFGRIYADLADKPKATQYLNEALGLSLELNYNENTGSCYLALAQLSNQEKDTAQEIHYTEKALEYVAKTRSEISQSACLRSLSSIYYAKGDFLKAYSYNQRALSFSKNAIDSVSHLYDQNMTGQLYVQLPDSFLQSKGVSPDQKFTLAIQYHKTLLDFGSRKNILKAKHDALQALSITYETMQDYAKALDAFQQLMVVNDSILNDDKKAKATRQELAYQFRIKEDSLRYRQQLAEQQLATEQLISAQRQQRVLLIGKEKDLERLRFLQQQTVLQRENEKQVALVNRQKLANVYEAALKDKTIASQQSDLQYSRKLVWIISLAVLLLLALLAFIYYHLRKRARDNKLIKQQNLELEQLHTVKNKLFSVVSHDMRAPIGSLITFMDLVNNQDLSSEDIAHYAPLLKQNLAHTSMMMDNLLKWASSQMAGFKPHPVTFNLRTLTAEIMAGMQHAAAEKQLQLTNNIPESLALYADKDMTQLIIRNLLNNAIKFSQAKRPVIGTGEQQQEDASIERQDQGIGIDDAIVAQFNQNNIAEMMQTTAGTNNEKGTGLGLFLCKTFAALMQGNIYLKSKKGSGSTFIISLPAQPL